MQLSFAHMIRAGPFKRIVRKAKVFAMAKGFYGRRKNCYTIAVRAVHKALQKQYISRKLKKRDLRKLWIQRINFGSREHNLPYSQFIQNLNTCDIQLNRKVLADLAIHEPRSFHALAELVKRKQADGLLAALD